VLEKELRVNGYHLEELNHNNIWVIGNGESRKNVNLKSLNGMTIGCNAIHRDHVCDSIIAVDRRMVTEIVNNSLYQNIPIYTRPDWITNFKNYKNVHVVPELPYQGDQRWDNPWHWNSGPFAVLLGCLHNPKTINLLGFDLYGINNRVNNLYKNTKNYDKEDHHAIGNDHWLHQLAKLFDYFSDIQFIQWQTKDWTLPDKWLYSKNLTVKALNV